MAHNSTRAAARRALSVIRCWYASDRKMTARGSDRSRFLIDRVKPVVRELERLAK